MGKKRQKVRWISIENESDLFAGEEISSSSERMPVEKGNTSSGNNNNNISNYSKSGGSNGGVVISQGGNYSAPKFYHEKSAYSRRPVAPRFERKAAEESVIDHHHNNPYRGEGESSEEQLPLGFTKIRSKNLDVLFKRDYYSTKGGNSGGMNSDANTHSETSSTTHKEDEKEDVEEEEEEEDDDEEEEDEEEEEGEEEITSQAPEKKKENQPKFTSKLNGSSTPFYPSGYIPCSPPMPLHPYITGRPNLFLYSPSSNTMIPCEEIVVPGMCGGATPSSPQSMYLAAFPVDGGGGTFVMPHSSYSYYHHPIYGTSDAEPSSADSTTPHSPPDLSAYSPAHWGDVYVDPMMRQHHQPISSYHPPPQPHVPPQYDPQAASPPVINDESNEKSKTPAANERPSIPGLPPASKKSQKKKRKKRNNTNANSTHRDSTSSEDAKPLAILSPSQTIENNQTSEKIPADLSPEETPEVPSPKEGTVEKSSSDPSFSPKEETEEEERADEKDDVSSAVYEENKRTEEPVNEEPEVKVVSKEDSITLSPTETDIDRPNASTVEEPVVTKDKTSPVISLPIEEEQKEERSPSTEKVQTEKAPEPVSPPPPRMLYSSVVSQSRQEQQQQLPPPPPSKKESSVSLEDLRREEESEWCESSSRKKSKRLRHLKKSKSLHSSSVVRSVSLDTSVSQKPKPRQEEKEEPVIPMSASLDELPSESVSKEEPQKEVKEEVEEVKPPVSSAPSSRKSTLKKKKKRGGGSDNPSSSSLAESNSAKRQVLICDGDINITSTLSTFQRASSILNGYRINQAVKKGHLDTLFISDIGIGIKDGPISSGRLRVGKYNPPDRSDEILSMKKSLDSKENTPFEKQNAQDITLD